ncbi:MAG: nicotinamide-nucleotide adenylyltransferase [Candidatus Aenigmarchaeota archaeon]|nr:nicotinamide-nucleotide adenylyltransferase [Candidatus Aenigmarchaeota archaeon]
MKRGLFIGRFQPFHLGHFYVVNDMEKSDVNELVIGIGSAQIGYTAYNPFTAEERGQMIKRSLSLEIPYHIARINDINDYPRWVTHVKSLTPEFHVVYSSNGIVKRLFEECGYEVRPVTHVSMISATEIRQLMVTGGNWQDYVPLGTRDVIFEVNGIERLKEITGKYMNPAVTADIIINYKGRGIVLIRRRHEPFRGYWALPGGFLNTGQESLETTARREVKEETSLTIECLELVGVYSNPERDPRGPVVSVAYSTDVNEGEPKADDDASEVAVFDKIPENLAFDHGKMLSDYFRHKERAK